MVKYHKWFVAHLPVSNDNFNMHKSLLSIRVCKHINYSRDLNIVQHFKYIAHSLAVCH